MSFPYSIDVANSDIHNLYHLLDSLMEHINDLDFERDGQRLTELDRIAALCWIARQEAERIGNEIEDNLFRKPECTDADTFERLGEVLPRAFPDMAPDQSNYQVDEGGAS